MKKQDNLPSTARRATQRDIAIKAGVGRSTVSLALKGYPKITLKTRERILKIAESLGYVPDPMLSALANYRNRISQRAFHGTVAWVVNVLSDYKWESGPYYSSYFSGASKRAESYGYHLEKFTFGANGVTANRLASILKARNVTGILLCPQPKADMRMSFRWDEFSMVTFGYTLVDPLLHTVASAHYLNTRRAAHELLTRGYRRIGLVIDEKTDRRCGSNVLAGYLVEQALDDRMAKLPPFSDYEAENTGTEEYKEKLAAYIKRHKIDSLLTSDYKIIDTLAKIGLSVPHDIGVAGISLPNMDGPISGMVEDSAQIGSVAMDILVGMVQRGECGVPASPLRTHLEGVWHEGSSLLERSA